MIPMPFYKIKPQIRVVGFDDGTFRFKGRGKTVLVGVVMKGALDVVGVLTRWIDVDGRDATERMVEAVKSSRFRDLRVILLKGITYAGFNVVDVEALYSETGLPVLVVVRKRPDVMAMEKALRKHFPDAEERIALLRKAPPLKELIPGKLYYQAVGLLEREAEEIIKTTQRSALIPEPLRLAHMIAGAIMTGESTRE